MPIYAHILPHISSGRPTVRVPSARREEHRRYRMICVESPCVGQYREWSRTPRPGARGNEQTSAPHARLDEVADVQLVEQRRDGVVDVHSESLSAWKPTTTNGNRPSRPSSTSTGKRHDDIRAGRGAVRGYHLHSGAGRVLPPCGDGLGAAPAAARAISYSLPPPHQRPAGVARVSFPHTLTGRLAALAVHFDERAGAQVAEPGELVEQGVAALSQFLDRQWARSDFLSYCKL